MSVDLIIPWTKECGRRAGIRMNAIAMNALAGDDRPKPNHQRCVSCNYHDPRVFRFCAMCGCPAPPAPPPNEWTTGGRINKGDMVVLNQGDRFTPVFKADRSFDVLGVVTTNEPSGHARFTTTVKFGGSGSTPYEVHPSWTDPRNWSNHDKPNPRRWWQFWRWFS